MPAETVQGCHVSARLEQEGRRAALASAPSASSVKHQPPGAPVKAEASQGTGAAQHDDTLLDPTTPKKETKRDRASVGIPSPPDLKKKRVVESVDACRPAQFGQPNKQQDGKFSKMKGVKRAREVEEADDDDQDDPLQPPSDDGEDQ